MNEQDMNIDEKIEKREKTDITISYAMIVILLVCIGFVLFLKLTNKEDVNTNNNDDDTVEEVRNITLDELSNTVTSRLSSKYSDISVSSDNNGLNIIYGDINYALPLINNELEFTIDSDNKELSEDIYKELLATICTYYYEDRDGCNNASSNLDSSNSMTGVRFVGNDKVYIDIINAIKLDFNNNNNNANEVQETNSDLIILE